MENEQKVASLLVYGGQHESQVSLQTFVMLASNKTVGIKHGETLFAFLPKAGTVPDGARIIAAAMVAYPNEAHDLVAELRNRPKEFFVGRQEKRNEYVFMSSVCGVLMALHSGISTESLEKEVSQFLTRALTEIADRTKEDFDGDATKGILTNNCGGYLNPKEYVPHRSEAVADLLDKVGKAGTEKLLSPGPFASEVLNQLRHKTLERLHVFSSLKLLAVEYRRETCTAE